MRRISTEPFANAVRWRSNVPLSDGSGLQERRNSQHEWCLHFTTQLGAFGLFTLLRPGTAALQLWGFQSWFGVALRLAERCERPNLV